MTALNISHLAIDIRNKTGISVTGIKLVGGYWCIEIGNYWYKASELLGGKHE